MPAQGVEVVLYHIATGRRAARWAAATPTRTAVSGDCSTLTLERGDYRIEFRVTGVFFGTITMAFRVTDPSRSYHVPLLMAPYSVASYRGS